MPLDVVDGDDDEEMADDGEYNIFAALKKDEEVEKEAASKYIDTRIFLSYTHCALATCNM